MESVEPTSGTDPPAPDSAAQPDQEAVRRFADLVERTELVVFALHVQRVRNASTAEDLTQETFLCAWRAWARYDASQDGGGWICTIAENVLASHFRRTQAKKRGRPLSLDELVDGRSVGDDGRNGEPADARAEEPVNTVMFRESVRVMDEAADGLSATDRDLYYLLREGLTLDEIAERTGRSKAAIASALTRLRARLRSRLARQNS